MSGTVDDAKHRLETILDDPSNTRGLAAAASAVIEARDTEGLDLLAAVLEVAPDTTLLDPLWSLANSAEAGAGVRCDAVQAIAALLVSAKLSLEDQTEKNPLTREQVDGGTDRLMALYNAESQPSDLRRRSLEMAANLRDDATIRAAGDKAFSSEDPLWCATGLFVLRITDKARGRELVEQALEHKLPEVRFEAIAGLAELGSDQDYERLTDFIYDGTPDERSAALWALVEIPEERAGNILVEAQQWLAGKAQIEAQTANAEWVDSWADLLSAGEEPEPRATRISSSRRSLDRYLADDFDFGGDD